MRSLAPPARAKQPGQGETGRREGQVRIDICVGSPPCQVGSVLTTSLHNPGQLGYELGTYIIIYLQQVHVYT